MLSNIHAAAKASFNSLLYCASVITKATRQGSCVLEEVWILNWKRWNWWCRECKCRHFLAVFFVLQPNGACGLSQQNPIRWMRTSTAFWSFYRLWLDTPVAESMLGSLLNKRVSCLQLHLKEEEWPNVPKAMVEHPPPPCPAPGRCFHSAPP